MRVIVSGYVQGVFFRDFTAGLGMRLGLTGYVMNLPNGKSVEVRAEGAKEKLGELIEHLKVGPPAAKVAGVKVEWAEYTGSFKAFGIR